MSERKSIPTDSPHSPLPDDIQPVGSTVIERYFARPSHQGGMSFEVTFELDSPVDHERCERAWREALQLHPRTHSKLLGSGKRQSWHLLPVDSVRSIASVDDASLETLEPCVRSGRGAVLVLCDDNESPFVRLKFHHAACDAVGAGRMVGDFFSLFHGYDRLAKTSKREAVNHRIPTDPKPSPELPSSNPITPDLRHVWRTIQGKNVRVDAHLDLAANPEGEDSFTGKHRRNVGPNTIAFELGEETSGKLREHLRRRKTPLNDFAVAIVSLALADLSRESASGSMRVMVMNPVQMRTWSTRRSSANHLGFAFIRRRHDQLKWSDCIDIDDVLGSIHQELSDVRGHGIAGELVWGIGLMEHLPGSLTAIERMGWFTPTASVTCLTSIKFARRYGFADGMSIGNAAVKRVNMVAPVQAGGQLAVTIWNLGNEISWSLRIRGSSDEQPHRSRLQQRTLDRLASKIASLSKTFTNQNT